MSADQIIEFLENYRMLFSMIPEKSQLISIKIEPSLLKAFKRRAELENTPYQTQIKRLMKNWITLDMRHPLRDCSQTHD